MKSEKGIGNGLTELRLQPHKISFFPETASKTNSNGPSLFCEADPTLTLAFTKSFKVEVVRHVSNVLLLSNSSNSGEE